MRLVFVGKSFTRKLEEKDNNTVCAAVLTTSFKNKISLTKSKIFN